MSEVRTSTGNKIHKRTNHLLIEVLLEGFFFLTGRLEVAFGVKWCGDCAGVVHAEAFTYLCDVLVLAEPDGVRSVGDFDA